jgi:leucyl/phenylalanyl-tRNA--protein transferase
VFVVGSVKRSRSVRQVIRRDDLDVTLDTAFPAVMAACADRAEEGTWITQRMQAAYESLHRMGHAHSVEVWRDGVLVGGLYGIAVGGVFTGESMFHRVSNASKVALVALDDHLLDRGFSLIDAQLHTDHLESMGARMVDRAAFLDVLHAVRDAPITFL